MPGLLLLLLLLASSSVLSAPMTFRAWRTYSNSHHIVPRPYHLITYDLVAADGKLKAGKVLSNITGALSQGSTQSPTALINGSIAVVPGAFSATPTGAPTQDAIIGLDLSATGTVPVSFKVITGHTLSFGVQYSPADDLILFLQATRGAGSGDAIQAYSVHTHGQGKFPVGNPIELTTRIGLSGANAFDVKGRKLYCVVGTEAPDLAPKLLTYDVASKTLSQGEINADNLQVIELAVASDGSLHTIAANFSVSALPTIHVGTLDPVTGKVTLAAAIDPPVAQVYRGTCHFDPDKKEWWSLFTLSGASDNSMLHVDATSGKVIGQYDNDEFTTDDPYGCHALPARMG